MNDNTPARTWVIKNMKGHVIGRYASLKAASRARDRLDNAYGASVHSIHPEA